VVVCVHHLQGADPGTKQFHRHFQVRGGVGDFQDLYDRAVRQLDRLSKLDARSVQQVLPDLVE
jgi:hypothetical protein